MWRNIVITNLSNTATVNVLIQTTGSIKAQPLFLSILFSSENNSLAFSHLLRVSRSEIMIQRSHTDQIDQMCASLAPTTCAIVSITQAVYLGRQIELLLCEVILKMNFITISKHLSLVTPCLQEIPPTPRFWPSSQYYGNIYIDIMGKHYSYLKINIYNISKLGPILGSSSCEMYVCQCFIQTISNVCTL